MRQSQYVVDYHDETTLYSVLRILFCLGRFGLSVGSKSSGPGTAVRAAQELFRPMLNGADACASPDHDKFIGKGANAERVNAVSASPHCYLTTLYYYCYCLNSLHFTNNVMYLSI